MVAYRLLDHTADLGFECEASSLEELFATAALALADIMARTEALQGSETISVEVSAGDEEARLRAFLEETLFHFETKGFLAREATVRFEGEKVLAALEGERVDLTSHPIERVVKAVTYHGLEIEETSGGFRCRVILDL
jgi:SHS2 domain-containing protein